MNGGSLNEGPRGSSLLGFFLIALSVSRSAQALKKLALRHRECSGGHWMATITRCDPEQ